ncbi:insulinase family protein [Streptococcus ilei]|uniref:EF-P 5-aminopentanol modification-associated protein YfmH n=1 Tax=Streptococcus ilei TaxID=1156431 RepID=UPI000E43AACC|nr:pitrilysin family protein [Streptococcus ilei]RGM74791.1 insulinase family protein [Streptococcus ilei]
MIKKDLEKIDYPAVGECVYQTSLQNGLKLYLIPKADFNESYAIISTKFGSIDTRFTVDGVEGIKEFPAGIAHFLEHKLFEDQDGQDYLQHFVKLGAESNAFTSFTQTSYLFSTTSNVNENLRLLLEMTQSLHLSKDSLKKEQLIIQQEIEMYQDSPDYQLFFRALANLYPETPLAQDIAGTVSSLSQIDEKSLQDNFDYFYQPSNMQLVVVGNFDLDSLVNLVSDFEMKTSLSPLPHISPVDLNPVVQNETSRMEVASPKLAIGIRGRNQIPPMYQYRYKIILKLLFAMMFGWTSKRFQSLYEVGKLDNSLTLEIEVESSFHFVMLTMDTSEPVSISHQFRTAIKNFEKDPDVTQEHLDTIKSEMFGDFLHGLNSLDYIAPQFNPIETGENLFDLPKILQSISLQDVVKVGRDFVNACDMTDFIIFPK